jgi:hypothetical protein
MAAAKVSLLLQLPTAPPTIPLPRQRRRRHLPITIAMASSSSDDSPKQVVVGTYHLLPSLFPIPFGLPPPATAASAHHRRRGQMLVLYL